MHKLNIWFARVRLISKPNVSPKYIRPKLLLPYVYHRGPRTRRITSFFFLPLTSWKWVWNICCTIPAFHPTRLLFVFYSKRSFICLSPPGGASRLYLGIEEWNKTDDRNLLKASLKVPPPLFKCAAYWSTFRANKCLSAFYSQFCLLFFPIPPTLFKWAKNAEPPAIP